MIGKTERGRGTWTDSVFTLLSSDVYTFVPPRCLSDNKGSSGAEYEACMQSTCLPQGREADRQVRLGYLKPNLLTYAPFAPQQMAQAAGLAYVDLQLPMLMRALYGPRTPKFVFVFRNPIDRIFSAFAG